MSFTKIPLQIFFQNSALLKEVLSKLSDFQIWHFGIQSDQWWWSSDRCRLMHPFPPIFAHKQTMWTVSNRFWCGPSEWQLSERRESGENRLPDWRDSVILKIQDGGSLPGLPLSPSDPDLENHAPEHGLKHMQCVGVQSVSLRPPTFGQYAISAADLARSRIAHLKTLRCYKG